MVARERCATLTVVTQDPAFLTTHWSLVRAAGGRGGEAAVALDELCRAYWFPLYAYVRRCGVEAHAAEDLVQGFLARLIERRDLEALSPENGRFRAFLRTAIRNHVANWRAGERAEKRGGGRVLREADFADANERLEREAPAEDDPERAFERAWAHELLAAAAEDVRRDYAASGRARVFEELKVELQRAGDSDIEAHAQALGMTNGACAVAIHRLRTRFREKLEQRVRATLGPEEDWEAELGELLAALARKNAGGL